MGDYWNKRFTEEGMIWGCEPSQTVTQAIDLFKKIMYMIFWFLVLDMEEIRRRSLLIFRLMELRYLVQL